VSAGLTKQAKIAEDQSVEGENGKAVNKRRTPQEKPDKTGSTTKAGGLRENIYK
jgi:hypothetical protein